MKWEGNRQSDNVEDRRGRGGRRAGGIGLGTIVLGLVASYFLGINPMTAINAINGVQGALPSSQEAPSEAETVAQDRSTVFVRTVMADTEDTWSKIFAASGERYPAPKLVLYNAATPTACGDGQAAMGSFYCPADQKVYLDLDFFTTLERQLQSPGEFAKAYVIAHEVGHHIQKIMGTTDKIDAMRGRVDAATQNEYSVRLELQADCYAGVWANHADAQRQILENGDIEAAMNAAQQIGDDTLQKKSQGYIVPDSFTHGTSAQRMRWFNTGLQSGRVQDCQTFEAKTL